MDLNETNGFSGQVNPAHIVPVTDFSPLVLRSIVDHIEVSTDFEHFVYREAELDAIWSITGFFLINEPDSSEFENVALLRTVAHKAHDLVADCRPHDAAQVLRNFLRES